MPTGVNIGLDDTGKRLVASAPHTEAPFESGERLWRTARATKAVRVVQLLVVPRHAAEHAMAARLANPTSSACTAAAAHLLHQNDDTDRPARRLAQPLPACRTDVLGLQPLSHEHNP